MKIAIDLTSLSYHLTGIERYAMGVTDKMLDLDPNNEYVLIFREEIFPLFVNRIDGKRIKAVVLQGKNKFIFLQFVLTNTLRKIKADKYIFFAFPGPILFRKKGIINTIHDMGAWDYSKAMTTLSRYYFRISYRIAAKISEKIITVSNFSKGRIHEVLGVPKERIEVIYSAIYEEILNENTITFEVVRNEYGLPDKYIMTLSTLEPRKNMKLLLEAYNKVADCVDYDLVLVGRKGWKIDAVIDEYKVKERIHITGFVEDEHLSAIYKNALCFVFPSLYEGFGLPPVEALEMGIPVISSNAASMPEILRNQAVFFKSGDKNELRDLLLNLESNVGQMPCEMDKYQKANYRFDVSAKKILQILSE